MTEFISENWLELLIGLMAFIKIIINLTPTEEDNKVFGYLDSIFNALFPNYKKGAGTHEKHKRIIKSFGYYDNFQRKKVWRFKKVVIQKNNWRCCCYLCNNLHEWCNNLGRRCIVFYWCIAFVFINV